ncbi:MAG: MAPEG family protein [Pseudomonadota bacterium]
MPEAYSALQAGGAIMAPSLWALFACIVLGILHISLSSMLSLAQLGPAYILSARDEPREPVGLAGRIARSYRNYLENFAQFVAAIALVHFSNTSGALAGVGAWMFFAGRVFYIPAYAFAPPGVRPIMWMVAQIGVVIILADLFV